MAETMDGLLGFIREYHRPLFLLFLILGVYATDFMFKLTIDRASFAGSRGDKSLVESARKKSNFFFSNLLIAVWMVKNFKHMTTGSKRMALIGVVRVTGYQPLDYK